MNVPLLVWALLTIGPLILIPAAYLAYCFFADPTSKNGVEVSVKGCKLVRRGKFAFATGWLTAGVLIVHFEDGSYCAAPGLKSLDIPPGTMIRVYRHKTSGKCRVLEDRKFLDVH